MLAAGQKNQSFWMLLFCGSVLEKICRDITLILVFSAAFIICHSKICVLMGNVMEKNVNMEQVEKTIQVLRIMFTVSVQKLKNNQRLFS